MNRYSPWAGALPKGGDLHSGNYTIAEAEAFCNATDACAGFTFRASLEEEAAAEEAAAEEAAAEEAVAGGTQSAARTQVAEEEDEHGHPHHGHPHHLPHGEGGGGVAMTRRDLAHTSPPSPPDSPSADEAAMAAAGGKAPGKALVYFKRAFTPNRDQHWRSFAKVWRDQDTNGEMAGGFEPSSPSSKLWLPLLPHWMPSCDHLDAEL